MDRKLLLENLHEAKERVELGLEHLARQRRIVEQLRRGGHDTQRALEVLAAFELCQQNHEADELRIQEELERVRRLKGLQKMGWDG